jgi:hypothetical protein
MAVSEMIRSESWPENDADMTRTQFLLLSCISLTRGLKLKQYEGQKNNFEI